MALPSIGEVGDNMSRIVKAFPKETEKFMKSEAKDLRKQIIDFAKTRVKKLTGNYFKGFKAGKKVYKWSDAEFNVRVYNTMPHAHLIEDGHRVVVAGKQIGFAPGKHVMEDAAKLFEPKFQAHVENDLADFIVKELEK